MIIARAYLALAGLALAAFGLWFLIDPIAGAARLGLIVSGDNAAYELRGIYGGVSLALAASALAGAIRPALIRAAFWPVLAYFGGYTFARLFSILHGEIPTGPYIAYTAFEVAMFALGIGARLTLKPAR